MSTRRDAREWAVQLLFQLDLNPSDKLEEVYKEFWSSRTVDKKSRQFTEERVSGVMNNIKDVDITLKKYTDNWEISRMGVVDRNVMRLALYEMMSCKDIPSAVIINEAVDIAKYFSTSESGKFVNGVLDRVRKDME